MGVLPAGRVFTFIFVNIGVQEGLFTMNGHILKDTFIGCVQLITFLAAYRALTTVWF